MFGYRMFVCVGLALTLVCLLPLWAGQDAPVLKVGVKAAEDTKTVIDFLKEQTLNQDR